ncbi:uncharacterized protein EURHEDRAFT_413793 [Aspergillus ruber CBS 135680]|uniref:Mucin n=1 Tax=Aspergillus ruber (strain CBS 135680) TaxID=1388766 RepID=A0A017SAF8_ASPRC|nr:uncharacterized protein EURHEDRAFT_413793 [Aspergillus ruber CBS 135680]EYE93806.1 hypothetical protein EURHEDRAFT_413793 [Aspergillus ruber CBS 135680]
MMMFTEEEYESLPPALQRKFFSNTERLRMRLAHSDPSSTANGGPDYPASALASALPRRLHFQNLRRRPNHTTTAATPASATAGSAVRRRASANNNKKKRSRRLNTFSSHDSYNSSVTASSLLPPSSAQKPQLSSLQLAYLSAQVDSQCFQSLPPKVQQKFFSPDERAYLRQVYRDSVILDSADQAVYRLEQKKKQTHPSCESLPSDTTTTDLSQTSTLYIESSDSGWDTEGEPDDEMDNSINDSFRWLDGDGDLDLRLDDYHAHVANANPVPKQPPRRKPSFRRTMSFSANRQARKAASSISNCAVPGSSQSSTVPSSLANIVGRTSTSRPPSGYQRPTMHAPRSSTSSIDPAAQYYQDPEARLKLRVYLASPQKFDEAIEFGFPALNDGKNDNTLSERPERVSEGLASPKVQKLTGTFFEDANGAVHGHRCSTDKNRRKSSRLSTVARVPQNLKNPPNKRQTCTAAPPPALRRVPGNREMTLKMTLTRPDLREQSSPSVSPTSAEDPLKPEELPPVADSYPDIWDESDSEQQNVMKKMWRRLRKPKY